MWWTASAPGIAMCQSCAGGIFRTINAKWRTSWLAGSATTADNRPCVIWTTGPDGDAFRQIEDEC